MFTEKIIEVMITATEEQVLVFVKMLQEYANQAPAFYESQIKIEELKSKILNFKN